MVLEKTSESPLDCKEIKPVNPKGNQPLVFTGRTDPDLICLILANGAPRHLPAHLLDNRQLSRATPGVMPSNHLILCRPLLLLPSIFPSIRIFSNESPLCIRWPKYWSFSLNISRYNEYLGLISFRMYWVDLLAVQGTLKSLLQHYSSKASILRCSGFFRVQLSYPYMTTGKTIALTR